MPRGLRGGRAGAIRSSPNARNAGQRMSTPNESENGLQAEEIEDYHQLRVLLSPAVSLSLLDDFAKWLFTLTGTVAAIGAGLGVTGATHLSDDGHRLFAKAVVLVALSLALAAFARLPLPVHMNRYSAVAMRRGLRRVMWTRFVLLATATVLFTAGLALAGWAQVS
jgi:hypothetical protein